MLLRAEFGQEKQERETVGGGGNDSLWESQLSPTNMGLLTSAKSFVKLPYGLYNKTSKTKTTPLDSYQLYNLFSVLLTLVCWYLSNKAEESQRALIKPK